MKVAIYARVSTRDKEQNPEVQLNQLRKYVVAMDWQVYREYVDKVSAADLINRKEWTQLMKDASVRKFDIVLIWKLDRAFRSVVHASTTINILASYKVGFKSYTDAAIDTTTANGMLVFNILASVAQFEKDLITQRINAGIDYAKEHGTKSGKAIGRPSALISDYDVRITLDAFGGNFSKTARALTENTGVKVSPGFVASRIKRMALQKVGQKKALLQNEKVGGNG